MSDVPGERGVPAGGAGEHPEVLLDGEDNNCSWSEYPFTQEDIVKGSGYISAQCCGNSEIELGGGVCDRDGDQPVPGYRPLYA